MAVYLKPVTLPGVSESLRKYSGEATAYLGKFKGYLIAACEKNEFFRQFLSKLCEKMRCKKGVIDLNELLTDESMSSDGFKSLLFVFQQGLDKFLLNLDDKKNTIRLYDMISGAVNTAFYCLNRRDDVTDEDDGNLFCPIERGGPCKIIIKKILQDKKQKEALLIIEDFARVLKPDSIIVRNNYDFRLEPEEEYAGVDALSKAVTGLRQLSLKELFFKYSKRRVYLKVSRNLFSKKIKLTAENLRADEVDVLEHYLKDKYEIKVKDYYPDDY